MAERYSIMPSPKRRRSSNACESIKKRAPCAGFEYEVLVLIYFSSNGENGMPQSEKDLSAVDDIEDRFKDRLEATSSAILALVITCDGARELYFYSSDPEAAMQPRMRTRKFA